MPTKTFICQLMLGMCGVSPVLDNVDTDNTVEARACKLWYDHVRDLVMEMLPWPCLEVEVELQLTGTAPDEWRFAYDYPSDIKRVNAIKNPGNRTPQLKEDKPPFKVVMNPLTGRKMLLTDEENAVAICNYHQTDPEFYPANLVQAIAAFGAKFVGVSLKADAKMMQLVNAEINVWLGLADSCGKSERQDDPEAESQHVLMRR